MDKEQWRAIDGYEGSYEVSNHGRVRSLDRIIIEKTGKRQTRYGTVLVFSRTNGGYPQVNLHMKGRQTVARVHRLVAAAFIGPCPDGLQVNHINGNKLDNHVGNLEYVTQSENMWHSIHILGNSPPIPPDDQRGKKNPNAKLNEDMVREIRRRYADGEAKQDDIALEFGICQAAVSMIVNRVRWSHV